MTTLTLDYQDHWICVTLNKYTLALALRIQTCLRLTEISTFCVYSACKDPAQSTQGQAPSLKHQQYLMHKHDLNSTPLIHTCTRTHTHTGACHTLPRTFFLSFPPPVSSTE